ncbi:MAG: tetratricopeptide repeat protein [bacterium]|nr:tetratricopeptide repeat protein [bacterium]
MLAAAILPASKKKKAEQLVIEGLVKLDNQNNDQARQSFRQAILLGREKIAPYMLNLFNGFMQNQRWPDALAIGKPLSTFFEQDPKLYNQLGNLYRRLGEFEEAQKHYKKSIQINKKFDLPYLNLAALGAKVDAFDEDIKPLIERFKKIKEFVLPQYEGGRNMLGLLAREVLVEMGDPHALEANEPAQLVELADIEEMVEALQNRALEALDMATDSIGIEAANKHLANLVIYSLHHKKLEHAQDGLKHMERIGITYHYAQLLRAIYLAYRDELEEAALILRAEQAAKPMDRYYATNLGLVYRLMKRHHQASVFLIRAGHLLKMSHGFYSGEEIERLAREFYQERKFQEALGLFQIIAQTEPEPRIWRAMARCSYFQQRFGQSYKLMKDGLEQTPAEQRPEYEAKAQAFYLEEATKAAQSKRGDKVLTLIEYALHFKRDPEGLLQASKLAYQVSDSFKSAAYLEEYHELLGNDKVDQREQKRLRYIQLAKEYLAKKEYQSAIHHFELAFDMKLDKDVFVFLASIYKRFKHQRALTSLMQRWKWMLEQEKERQMAAEMRATNEASE